MHRIQQVRHHLETAGDLAVDAFHYLGLFVIGGTIIWAAIHTYITDIMSKPYASLHDILLLFIFLELGAMVGIYFRTHRLPVIYLLFISMTSVTRHLAVDIDQLDNRRVLTAVAAILLLSVAALILRYCENRLAPPESNLTEVDTQIERH
jgi:phosphate starvation-inducible membrane PsiE